MGVYVFKYLLLGLHITHFENIKINEGRVMEDFHLYIYTSIEKFR